ncbi:MAG: glycosyltransferase family 4 protein [Nostocoides sp.]
MRVAVIGHTAEPGGAELSLVRMLSELPEDAPEVIGLWFEDGDVVQRLRAQGLRVDVLAMKQSVRTVARTTVGGVSVGLLTQTGYSVWFAVEVARWLRRNDIDIVHTSTLKADLIGTVAACLARKPLVWHVRDRIAPDYMPMGAVRLLGALAGMAPTRVIANSWATAATLPRARGLTVAYPGYAPDMVRSAPRPRPTGPPVVGMLGRVSPTKGQHEFVQAAARVLRHHPDAQFRIVGAPTFGATAYAEQVRAAIVDLGLEDHVSWTGFVRDIRPELDAMSVCVHAAPVPEPFGNVLVEAMVRGVPVIGTNAGGVREILDPLPGEDPLGLLVRPGDVEELAEAIISVLDDEDSADDRAARAHRSAASRFPAWRATEVLLGVWQDVSGTWSSVIDDLVEQHWSDQFSPASLPLADAAFEVPPRVGYSVVNDDTAEVTVYIAHLPDGPMLELRESAALTWLAATGYPAQSWIDILTAVVGAPRELVTRQATDFVDELIEAGYLMSAASTASPSPELGG